MKQAVAIALAAAVALTVGTDCLLAQSGPPTPELLGQPYLIRVAPAERYADSTLTPGKADTFSAAAIQRRYKCSKGVKAGKKRTCTYSQTHRNVPASVKKAVYAAYEQLRPGITSYCQALDVRPARRKAFTVGRGQRCEVDHFCPVGIGCSNDQKNLWIQRADTTYNRQLMGFHQKDDLEAWGIAQVKAGALTPEEFDRRIWGDWVGYYLEVRPPHSNVSN